MNENNNEKLNTGTMQSPGDNFQQNGTYCKLGNEDSGLLEIDLQSFKQQGKETRHISISVVGLDNQQQINRTEMFVLDEATWNKFKDFVSKLNWND